MDASTITCPKCQHEFALTAAIERPIVEKLKASFAAQAAQRDAEIAARETKLCEAAEKLTGPAMIRPATKAMIADFDAHIEEIEARIPQEVWEDEELDGFRGLRPGGKVKRQQTAFSGGGLGAGGAASETGRVLPGRS